MSIVVKYSPIKKSRRVNIEKSNIFISVFCGLMYEPPEAPGEQRAGRRFRARALFVLPGEYQVKLKAADQEMTKTVQVEGNPRIDISFEDRKAQHDALFSIYKLSPSLSAASRASDNIRNEIKKMGSGFAIMREISLPLIMQVSP